MAEVAGTTSPPNLVEPERDIGRDPGQRRESGQDNAQTNPTNLGKESKVGAKKLGHCLPKARVMLEINIKWEGLDAHIQYMKDHALITKFVGIWLSEQSLVEWIDKYWKPKRGYHLRLRAKGFFTIIFYHVKDRNHLFEGGPYFYNSTGLYLTFWQERFSPEKAYLLVAPVWIRLYSLPCELWHQEIMKDIENAIGTFFKVAEQTKRMRYVSFARICVYLDISKELPENIKLTWHDEEWIQPIDYEHISFHCRRCHEHDHLFRQCPLNTSTQVLNQKGGKRMKMVMRK